MRGADGIGVVQVTDHKKVFMAWNALDLDDEAQHHEQVISGTTNRLFIV